ncbi:MAG: tyrosine decarboxylase MfnA [Candidatus Thermoplasmatota archaeon]|nr:tyrosine decarboxylase MfnA [Candidatus Thermoplasmatota archaeon]
MDHDLTKSGKDVKEITETLKNFKEKDFDFSSGRVFASMCTEPLDIAKEAYIEFIESNLGNPGLYPGTKEMENQVHKTVSSLINADRMKSVSVGGGTEGNIIALWRARESTDNRKVLLPKSAHFSFEKACSLLDMEPEYVSLMEDCTVDTVELEEKIDDDTAAVVGIAGTTEHGAIDPIEEIASLSGEIPFHVDAAFGGFVIPFLKMMEYDVPSLDLTTKGIDSISLDPHKMGMSPVPLGLFYSSGEKEISVDSPYLTGKDQKSIRGTRASASIPAFWATMNLLGIDGYKEIISDCMEKTDYLIELMEEKDFDTITEPRMNIASFRSEQPEVLVERCAEKDWYISRTVHPPGLRFVVMPHVTERSIEKIVGFLGELR